MSELEPLWTAVEIAEFLNVSARQVSERYAMQPDFPKPIRLPSPKGRGLYRWKKVEVLNWINSLQMAA